MSRHSKSPWVLVAVALACAPEPSTHNDDWLARVAIQLSTVEPGPSQQDLQALSDVIGSRRIVALGEIVHRAHEPLAFRNRLFQFLVETMGFRVIALETDLAQSQVLQDYVSGLDVDLDVVAPDVISWNFHLFGENAELHRPEFRGLLFRHLLEQAIQVEPVTYRSLVVNPPPSGRNPSRPPARAGWGPPRSASHRSPDHGVTTTGRGLPHSNGHPPYLFV